MRKRWGALVVVGFVALGFGLYYTLTTHGMRTGLAATAPLAAWAVAVATLGLATATYMVARQARNEAKAVREEATAVGRQAEIAADQLVAIQRPFVYPTKLALGHHVVGGPVLLLANSGTGPAINTRAWVWWPKNTARTQPVHVPAGEREQEAGIAWPQEDWVFPAPGYLRYTDLSGGEWQTHFELLSAQTVAVKYVGSTKKIGQPEYDAGGWNNPPPDLELWRLDDF